MPPKKRKAAETEDVAPRKSKAQQRAEAKARAAQWARETSAKKAAKKLAAQPLNETTTGTPSPVKRPAAKRRRMEDSKPAAAPSVKPASVPKAKSKKQLMREEARARAREWAHAQELASSKRALDVGASTAMVPNGGGDSVAGGVSSHATSPAVMSPPDAAPVVATRPTGPPPNPAVPLPVPSPVVPPAAPPTVARPPYERHEEAFPILPPVVLPAAHTVHPSAARPPYDAVEEEEKETPFVDAQETADEKATKGEGEEELAAISKQVIENFNRAHPAPAPLHGVGSPSLANTQHPQYFSPAPSEQQVYHDPPTDRYNEEIVPALRKWGVVSTISALAVVVACVVAHVGMTADINESLATGNNQPKLRPCFFSNAPDIQGENGEPLPQVDCDTSVDRIACPDRGICQNGLLRTCGDPRFDVAETRDICVLSEHSNNTVSLIEKTLVEWTVEDKCGLSGCDYARKSSSIGPVFPLSTLCEHENLSSIDPKLLELSSDFHVDNDEDQVTFVGLSDDYMENKLVLPVLCSWLLVLIAVLSSALNMFLGWVGFGTGIVWKLTMAYPLASIVCLVVLLFLRRQQRKREEGRRLIQDVANVRELAYGKLMDDPSKEHVVLHLRDEIAYELHPTSKTGRRYINLKVWKHVVGEVRLDNRVEKTERMLQGRPRDVWRWVANARRQPKVSFE